MATEFSTVTTLDFRQPHPQQGFIAWVLTREDGSPAVTAYPFESTGEATAAITQKAMHVMDEHTCMFLELTTLTENGEVFSDANLTRTEDGFTELNWFSLL